jgi:hypothetical protein
MDAPYETAEGAILMQEHILEPEYVSSGRDVVEVASHNFLEYIRTPEAETILLSSGAKPLHIPTIEAATQLARLNKEKISKRLADELVESGRVLQDYIWLIFDKESIDYYMTLLATEVASDKHFGLLTNESMYEPLADRARRGDNPAIDKQRLGEVLLAQVTLDTVEIAPETPIESLLDFRHDYKDEIGRFREEMGKLAKDIDPETKTLDGLQQQVQDIFINKVQPSINSLQRALGGRRVRTTVAHLSSIIFAGSINYLTPGTPANLATYAGCEIIGNTVNYLIDRKQELEENPYSFVLSARSNLS